MPTCPNCGSIVMNGDPYCRHCGTTFRWTIDSDDFENNNAFDDDTTRLLKKALNDAFNDPHNRDWVYLMIGNDYLDNGDYLKAYVAFKNCIEFNPKQDLAWAFLGIALMELGDIYDAKYCFSQSLKINPNNKFANEGLKDIPHNYLKNDAKLEVYKKDFESFLKSLSNNSKIDNSSNLYEKKENQKKVVSTDSNYKFTPVKVSVKFKLCENCGKKVNKIAKKCPYCNSTSFSNDTSNYVKKDNVKFCPSCHNRYYDSNFCSKCGDKLILKYEYEEMIKKEKQQYENELKNQKICPFCLNDEDNDGNFCILCGGKLISKWDYENLIKKLRIGDKQHFAEKFRSIKESEKQHKLKEKFGIKNCPICKQEIPKNAVRCLYCNNIFEYDLETDNDSDEVYLCINCRNEFSHNTFKKILKCPKCGGRYFKKLSSVRKEQPINSKENFDNCENDSKYIPNDSENCPHYESTNIKRKESKSETNNYKSPLKVKEISNDGLNYCKNCCTYISKDNEYCPHCGSTNIK